MRHALPPSSGLVGKQEEELIWIKKDIHKDCVHLFEMKTLQIGHNLISVISLQMTLQTEQNIQGWAEKWLQGCGNFSGKLRRKW